MLEKDNRKNIDFDLEPEPGYGSDSPQDNGNDCDDSSSYKGSPTESSSKSSERLVTSNPTQNQLSTTICQSIAKAMTQIIDSAPAQRTVPLVEVSSAEKTTVTEIPEQYRNVGFAKSVREKYKEDLTVSEQNTFDYVEELMLKRSISKAAKDGMMKRPKEDIIRDYISFRNGTRVTCELCMETFADKKSLLRHKVCRHEKFSPHQCKVCNKMFVKPGDVKRHMVTHTAERSFYCEHCHKSYKTKNHLRRHMKGKHPEHAAGWTMLNSEDEPSEDQVPDAVSREETVSTEIIHKNVVDSQIIAANNVMHTGMHENMMMHDNVIHSGFLSNTTGNVHLVFNAPHNLQSIHPGAD